MSLPATAPSLSYSELIHIVEMFRSASHFNEFRLKSGELELEARRGGAPGQGAVPAPVLLREEIGRVPAQPRADTPVQPDARVSTAAAAAEERATYSARAVKVTSPMVGTFYCAPEPGAAPFVQRGQKVEADTTLCIVEVMKLMNTICAGHAGVVADVLVQDGQPVEYGQLLMVIEPS